MRRPEPPLQLPGLHRARLHPKQPDAQSQGLEGRLVPQPHQVCGVCDRVAGRCELGRGWHRDCLRANGFAAVDCFRRCHPGRPASHLTARKSSRLLMDCCFSDLTPWPPSRCGKGEIPPSPFRRGARGEVPLSASACDELSRARGARGEVRPTFLSTAVNCYGEHSVGLSNMCYTTSW